MSGGWQASPDRGPLKLESAAGAREARPRRAAFLDRDGVLNHAVRDPCSGMHESPLDAEEVRLLPDAAAAVRQLAAAGYVLVCVSNQPAAAKGKATLPKLLSVHERVLDLLLAQDAPLAATLLCPHHPDGLVAELAGPCICRKPAAGMLLEAARMLNLDLGGSWMLGDTDADVGAGRAAGCGTMLIEYPPSAHKRSGAAKPDLLARDLAHGATQLLDRETG